MRHTGKPKVPGSSPPDIPIGRKSPRSRRSLRSVAYVACPPATCHLAAHRENVWLEVLFPAHRWPLVRPAHVFSSPSRFSRLLGFHWPHLRFFHWPVILNQKTTGCTTETQNRVDPEPRSLTPGSLGSWRGHPNDRLSPLVGGRGPPHLFPSPGDPLLFPMQRVTGEGQGEGAVPTCERLHE